MRVHLLGMPLDGLTRDRAVQTALSYCEQHRSPVPYAVTPNTEMVLEAQRNPALRRAAEGAAIAIPDSVGVQQAARILDLPIPERVPGIDFAEALLAALAQRGGSVFLFGSDRGAVRRAAGRLSRRYPGLRIAGLCDGYGGDPAEQIRPGRQHRPLGGTRNAGPAMDAPGGIGVAGKAAPRTAPRRTHAAAAPHLDAGSIRKETKVRNYIP